MKYWIANPFNYTINKYGFRCGSFDNLSAGKKLMTLGCSHSFGIGMPEHAIWPRLLADRLNFDLYNLSVPGGSADSAYRMIKIWFYKIQPDLVVWFFPPGVRFRCEKFNEDGVFNFGPWRPDPWYVYEKYARWSNNKNLEAIKYLIKDTPLIVQDSWPSIRHDDARDLDHRGLRDHEFLYQEILRKVENNEYT